MAEKKYQKVNDTESYRIPFHVSNKAGSISVKWDHFFRDSVGIQLGRAIDSVSANIAEGFGRKGKRDKATFYNCSYASVLESLNWNEKAKVRSLISKKENDYTFTGLQKLPKSIKALIKFTNEKLIL